MVAKAVVEQRCKDYYWAAIKVARATWRQYGQRTTVTREDAEAEGLLALTEAAASSRYDERRGTFGGFAKQAVLRAVRRHLLKAQHYTPVEEVREGPPVREEDQAQALKDWAAANPQHAAQLGEYIQGGDVSPDAEAALSDLRKAAGISWYALRAHDVRAAAKRLRINTRRIRALAESGDLTGRLVDGQWRILTTSCAAYLERRVASELKRQPTISAAARAARTSQPHAWRLAQRHDPRPRVEGRPRYIDTDLIRAILTDKEKHGAFWRRGRPRIRLIAQYFNCTERYIYKIAAT